MGRARAGDVPTGSCCRPARSARRPRVEVVDLREELAAGQRGLLSRPPRGRARGARPRAAGDQAILVLNRRGTASVVLCRDCGHVQACPDCERPLVYHQAGDDAALPPLRSGDPARDALPGLRLAAHPLPRRRHGARRARGPRARSPGCASGASTATSSSAGAPPSGSSTRSPTAGSTSSSARASSPRASTSRSVTLVGVVSSDVALNLPDERAAERTYQLLVQAIGRAGRGDRPGRAIVQTYQPDHPAIVAVGDGRARRVLRRRARPARAVRLAAVRAAGQADRRAGRSATAAEREAGAMADAAPGAGRGARPPRWRSSARPRRTSPAGPIAGAGTSSCAATDPVALLDGGLDAPWSVDVDPESLL